VHSRYDIAARRRLGLVAEEQDPSVLMGSEDLARNLQQHRSPLPTNLKQNFNTILQQYYEPDAAPQPSPAFRRTDEAHGDYSPAAQRLNLQTAAHSPAPAYSPHALAESPTASARLTAASQAAGVPPAAGKFRPRPAAPPAPYLGGAGVVNAGGIEVDEELLNAFQVHKATSPNSKKRDTRKFHHQGPRRGAAPPSFNAGAATMATPAPNLGANSNPLLSLLASAKGNASGCRGGRGSGGGGGGGNAGSGGTPRQPSNFRQPAIGTPGGGYGASTGVAVAGPSRFQREQQRNVALSATPAAAAAAADVTPAPALPDQQQDTILSSDEEGNELNPAPITGAARNMATPIGAQGIGGALAPGSGGSAGRLTGPQDSFLAGLAPPSTRAAHGNVRSRLGGGASGSGLQGRLKRARIADEIAAAAAASNGSNTHTVEAIIQTCSVELNVFKVRGLCHNSAIVDFFLPSPSLAQRADLAAGRKIVIRYPFRKVSIGNDGIELYFCTGEVFGQQNSN
jgi:hypothetical protein